ncbi:MAG TPA: ROK family protein [Candidatus Binataceae bacterium]|nr:ROK family protein [Candidatus Binataceae bacterium]
MVTNQIWVGVDIGGTKTAIVLSSKPPEIDARIEFPTLPEKGPERAIQLINGGIETLLKRRRAKSQIAGIGVSCGGPLDRIRGVIESPPNLPTWDGVPIVSILRRRFGVRCRLENDANAGAVAEHRYGAGRGCRNMVFLTMGTGLGAGLILENRLFRGSNDLAGEVGHLRLTRGGPIGHGKHGSAEGWISGGGVAQVAAAMVTDAVRRGEKTTLAALLQAHGLLTARDVGLAAARKDAIATRVVRATGERLGAVLAILVDLFNPDAIVIGGLALRLGDTLLAPAREVLNQEALSQPAAACRVLPAALGERIGDVAALCVAMGR